jgi:hypothetical protein
MSTRLEERLARLEGIRMEELEAQIGLRAGEGQMYMMGLRQVAARPGLRVRGVDGYPEGSDDLSQAVYGKIPVSDKFLNGLTAERPVAVWGWEWSTTFQRWTALVTFRSGWTGFTYPVSNH